MKTESRKESLIQKVKKVKPLKSLSANSTNEFNENKVIKWDENPQKNFHDHGPKRTKRQGRTQYCELLPPAMITELKLESKMNAVKKAGNEYLPKK
ncbi:hypothetical protein ACTXT7_014578 [Hymenolepis weldensis]